MLGVEFKKPIALTKRTAREKRWRQRKNERKNVNITVVVIRGWVPSNTESEINLFHTIRRTIPSKARVGGHLSPAWGDRLRGGEKKGLGLGIRQCEGKPEKEEAKNCSNYNWGQYS